MPSEIMSFFAIPIIIYVSSVMSFPEVLRGQSIWTLYVVLLPFILIIFPFIIYKHFKKIPIILLALIIFLVLQFLPLPRSAYVTYGAEGPSPRNEPFAIGVGYPFSIVKLFLGEGCLSGGEYNGACLESRNMVNGNPYIRLTPGQISPQDSNPTIHSGNLVLLPEGMMYTPTNWFGLFAYSYVIFFIILKLTRLKKTKTKKRAAGKL